MAIEIGNRQLIYPLNIINKAVNLFSAKVHLNNSYKIIHIGFTSDKNKEIFG